MVTILCFWIYSDLAGERRRLDPAPAVASRADGLPVVLADPPRRPDPEPSPRPPQPAVVPVPVPSPVPPRPAIVVPPSPVAVHAASPVRYWVKDSAVLGRWGHGRIVGGWLVDVDEWRWDQVPVYRAAPMPTQNIYSGYYGGYGCSAGACYGR